VQRIRPITEGAWVDRTMQVVGVRVVHESPMKFVRVDDARRNHALALRIEDTHPETGLRRRWCARQYILVNASDESVRFAASIRIVFERGENADTYGAVRLREPVRLAGWIYGATEIALVHPVDLTRAKLRRADEVGGGRSGAGAHQHRVDVRGKSPRIGRT